MRQYQSASASPAADFRSPVDRLAEHGILLKSARDGQHRVPCPECDKGKGDDALAVKIDARGACWRCFRCEWRGAVADRRADMPRPAARRPQERRAEPERHDTLAPWARALWLNCQPIAGIAATYLERRGCAIPPAAGDLRWHPAILHPSGHVGPALVALVTSLEETEPAPGGGIAPLPLTLHRTWIAPDGGGKAQLDKPRLLLPGHRAAGVVRLWPDSEIAGGLCLAEGIETALCAARGFGCAWAAISAGNLKAFPVLDGIEALTIAADHDKADRRGRRAGIEAAISCADRWADAGREVRVWQASDEGADFADWLTAEHREAAA